MLKTGKKYLVCTVSLYYVGTLEEIGTLGDLILLRLTAASWIPSTGRLGACLDEGVFREVEFVGEVFVSMLGVVGIYPWKHTLPTETEEGNSWE